MPRTRTPAYGHIRAVGALRYTTDPAHPAHGGLPHIEAVGPDGRPWFLSVQLFPEYVTPPAEYARRMRLLAQTLSKGAHTLDPQPPDAQIMCCGSWLPYPAPGAEVTCPHCRSVLFVRPVAIPEAPATDDDLPGCPVCDAEISHLTGCPVSRAYRSLAAAARSDLITTDEKVTDLSEALAELLAAIGADAGARWSDCEDCQTTAGCRCNTGNR